MENAAPQTTAVIPVACFPGRLLCFSKARLSLPLCQLKQKQCVLQPFCCQTCCHQHPGDTPGVIQWVLTSSAMSTDGFPPAMARKVCPRSNKFTETAQKHLFDGSLRQGHPASWDLQELQGAPGSIISRAEEGMVGTWLVCSLTA